MRKIVITNEPPCKKCILLAICYSKDEIKCSTVTKWIKKHSYMGGNFNKNVYIQVMNKIAENLSGEVYSSRTWKNLIFNYENTHREGLIG